MSPKFKGLWRPSLFKLMLMILLLLVASSSQTWILNVYAADKRTHNNGPGDLSRSQLIADLDPMEPCYLSNNRASESLTISESTPVGTIVGEIMVNGDSSANGNIELSIRMPGGGSSESSRQVAAQRQSRQTNGFSSSSSSSSSSAAATATLLTKSSHSSGSSGVADKSSHWRNGATETSTGGGGNQLGAKSARDLNSLIDLMPPLSIEHDSKRLILAKKLDRENLDRYMLAGGYQASPISSLSQSSSASLTVHIKCQLRDKSVGIGKFGGAGTQHNTSSLSSSSVDSKQQQLNGTTTTTTSNRISGGGHSLPLPSLVATTKHANSILIPIHLIVTDENDNWPMFINSPYIVDLNETVNIGAPLPGNEIVAVDNDQQGPLSTIEYSIVPGNFWSDSFVFLNPLDSRSLIVKDNRLLDFESQSKLNLKVMARDQGEPPNWAISSLYINLVDNDDLNPVFGEDKYLGYVRENRPGELVEMSPKRLSARDGDKTLDVPLIYSFHLKTNHSIHFELDPDVGRLSLKKSLLEEPNFAPFCLLIRATQSDNPQRWSLTMVQVQLKQTPLASPLSQLEQLLAAGERQPQASTSNIESPPLPPAPSNNFRFAQPNFTIQVSEAAAAGYTILNLRASYLSNQQQHRELLPSNLVVDSVTYHLLDDELGYFNLDSRTGRLSLNKSLDYELYRQLTVRVLATLEEPTGGQFPRLTCDMVRVTINIQPNNDFTPEFSHEQYNFQLSVSDLIANFDLPKLQADGSTGQAEGENNSNNNNNNNFDDADGREQTNELRRRLIKRFGDIELSSGGDDGWSDEPLAWPAMQLGRIYCADRDYGDRLTLQLISSKANLFHLTQDGRLYLPLVNTSSPAGRSIASSGSSFKHHSELPATWSGSGKQARNNQFAQSRFFGPRRNSDFPLAFGGGELPDRNYLNYLLSEFSNLGRLRLKVLATDDGQPQRRQATALIVITVISIDNFILQRAPHLPPMRHRPVGADQQQDSNAIQLNNQTSYDTSRPTDSFLEGARENNRSQFQSQVMMIPATNGRSFVQINPDIISNLISQNPFHNNNQPTSNFGYSNSSSNSSNDNSSSHSGEFTPTSKLLRETGSGSKSSLGSNGSVELQAESSQIQSSQTSTRFQPPSLLLVDDDGAKFVAMPAAIEVYNQQVQEAADQQQQQQQQARQRSQLGRSQAGGSGKTQDESSLWHRWKSQFGFGSNNSARDPSSNVQVSGSLYWINLSTAIMLHLIALVVVVTLVSRLRWPPLLSRNRRGASGGLWPTRINRLSWRQSGEHSVANIMDQAASGNYGHSNLTCSESSESSASSFGFPHSNTCSSSVLQHTHQRPFMSSKQQSSPSSSSDNSNSRFASRGKQQPVSSGVVVSAISNGYKSRTALDEHLVTVAQMDAKQQNLFGHLKLTLNKMLDGNEEAHKQPEGCVGHVSIRPLDSDSIKFESFSHEASLVAQEQEQVQDLAQSDKELLSAINSVVQIGERSGRANNLQSSIETTAARSSTFVGQPTMISNNSNNQESSGRSTGVNQKQVVSINVSGPKLESKTGITTQSGQLNQRLASAAAAGSSSSSVVSLISMSSSISNKINAAVQRQGEHTATGSDVSSLDSSTLFNGTTSQGSNLAATNLVAKAATTAIKAAPPPPPPPPPPCLVQVGGRLVIESLRQAAAKQALHMEDESQTTSSTSNHATSKPFSARPPLCDPVDSLASVRRPLPQNPQHIKLRQQATSSSNVDHQAIGSGHQHQQQAASGSNNRKQSFKSGTSNKSALISMNTNQRPPTPPPLPTSTSTSASSSSSSSGQLPLSNLAPNAKTVSPTTSVDRGYESLQSYTSSSQQQFTTRNASINRGAKKETLSSHNRVSTSHQTRITATPINGLSHRRSVCGEDQTVGAANNNNTSSGQSNAARVRRASQTLAYGALSQSANLNMSSTHRLLGGSRHHRSSRGQQVTGENGSQLAASGHLKRSVTQNRSTSQRSSHQDENSINEKNLDGYETEDDDFYYCYNQLATAIGSDQLAAPGGGSSQMGNNALSEYVSHAYLKAGNGETCEFVGAHGRHSTSGNYGQTSDSPAQGRSATKFVATSKLNGSTAANVNGSDLMMMSQASLYHNQATSGAETHSTYHTKQAVNPHSRSHHHHHHHHPTHHHNHKSSTSSRQQLQLFNRQQQSLYSAAAAAKKQLTWSDQVALN